MLIKILIFLYFVAFILIIIAVVNNIMEFKHGTYTKMTGNGFFETIFNVGKHGEYLTYKELKLFEAGGGKFLFNCYLPKADGTTTEVDVILIHSTGIFVIESKNYSGWIFGNERNKTWTQTLRGSGGKVQKEHFYNPIMQNNTHVKCLKKIIGNHVPVYSLIAFSQRCTLKNVTVENSKVRVINRQYISGAVKQMGDSSLHALSKMDVEHIFEMLYPYTQITEYERLNHIINVNAIKYETKIKPVNNIINWNTAEMDKVEKELNTNEEEKVGLDNKRICPRCGAELVLRVTKKGKHVGEQFYGCSRFPKCRYLMPN